MLLVNQYVHGVKSKLLILTAEGKPKGLQEFFDSTEGNSIHAQP